MKTKLSFQVLRRYLMPLAMRLVVFSFALLIFTGNTNAQTNVARGKSTRQSSTGSAGGAASLAVDGNRNGNFANNSVTHTKEEAGTWWEIDFGAIYFITNIKIYNRADRCRERLRNTRIAVSKTIFL